MANTKLVIIAVALVIIVSVAVALMMFSSSSLNIDVTDLHTSYSSGISFSTMTLRLTIKVFNKGVFPVTLYNGKVHLVINQLDLGSQPLAEDWYIISPELASNIAIGQAVGRTFTVTYTVSGNSAERLHATNAYSIRAVLRGEAACYLYHMFFEIFDYEQLTMAPS